MNDDTGGNRALRARVSRPTWPRRTAAAAATAGIALLAAACGAPSSSTPASGPGSTSYQKALAFAQCMRSHGVPDFPDPTTNGNGGVGFAVHSKPGQGGKVDLSGSQTQAAQQACRHLLPNGGVMNPAQQQQALNRALKFSQCMRTHGVPNFPDPHISNGGMGLTIGGNGLNLQSPQFQAAQRACQSLLSGLKGGPGGQTASGSGA